MKHLLTVVAILGSLTAAAAGRASQPSVTAFVGVNVLPMDKDAVLRDQTVILRDGRVAEVGPARRLQVPTREAAIQAVAAQKAAGYDLLKIHPGIQRDVFDALAAKAQEAGIDFAGHVPLDVGLPRALEAKYRCIDHLDGYVEAMSKNPTQSQFFGVNLIGEIDESLIPALVKATRTAGTWMVPTQVLFDNLLSEETPAAMAKRPEIRYALSQGDVQKWVAQKQNLTAKFSAADREKFLAVRRRLIKALYDAAVPFALGSDAPQWWNVPGFSAHRELKALVLAGLTPYQALRTGTIDVGRYFNTRDSGTVTPGSHADLMLLGAQSARGHRRQSAPCGRDAQWSMDAENRD